MANSLIDTKKADTTTDEFFTEADKALRALRTNYDAARRELKDSLNTADKRRNILVKVADNGLRKVLKKVVVKLDGASDAIKEPDKDRKKKRQEADDEQQEQYDKSDELFSEKFHEIFLATANRLNSALTKWEVNHPKVKE